MIFLLEFVARIILMILPILLDPSRKKQKDFNEQFLDRQKFVDGIKNDRTLFLAWQLDELVRKREGARNLGDSK